MKTEDLIKALVADIRPVVPGAAAWRIAGALVAGGFLSLIGIDLLLGSPLRAVVSTGVMVFAVKLAYATAMTAISANLLLQAGRPGHKLGFRWMWLLAPVAMVAAIASMELADTTPAERLPLIFGTSWKTCLVALISMSVPTVTALAWAFRRLAPTNLTRAGFFAGAAAGATASVVYALYCPETAASFMLVWYTLGILVSALAGAIAGQKLLRW